MEPIYIIPSKKNIIIYATNMEVDYFICAKDGEFLFARGGNNRYVYRYGNNRYTFINIDLQVIIYLIDCSFKRLGPDLLKLLIASY